MVFLKVSNDQKLRLVRAIQAYFRTERDEELGELAAGLLLDFFMEQLAPVLYNQAVDDLQTVLSQKMASFEEDLYALKIPIRPSGRKD